MNSNKNPLWPLTENNGHQYHNSQNLSLKTKKPVFINQIHRCQITLA